MLTADALISAVDRYTHIVIAGHVNPDGDAVGACFAMALFAAQRGKQPRILLGTYPPQYDVLRGGEFLWPGDWNDIPCELFIALDCGGVSRLGDAVPVFDRAACTINIDHHASNNGFAVHNAVDVGKSSTSELLYTLLQNEPLSVDMAAALFAGISFDTGGFRHPSATAETFEAVAALLRVGINASDIQRRMLYTHSMPATRIFSAALGKAAFSPNAPIVYAALTHADMDAAGALPLHLEGIVEHLLDIDGACASILVSEREKGVCKVSLRSRGLNMNTIAAGFGGGGHINAAGATIPGTADEALALILTACEEGWKAYEIQNNGC